jgi:hypothetical protein
LDARPRVQLVDTLRQQGVASLDEEPTSTPLRKLGATLDEFATYIGNNVGHIVDYGERYRAGERISTGFMESATRSWINVLTNGNRCVGRLAART